MEINWYYLIINWGINLLEFWIIYFVACALLGFKSVEALKKLNLKIIGFAFLYGFGMGTSAHLWPDLRHHAVGVVVMILTIRFLSKQFRLRLSKIDLVLVYFLLYIISQAAVIPIFILVSSFNWSVFTISFSTFVGSVLMLFLLFTVLDLSWLYKLVAQKFIVKLIIFTLFAIFVISFIIINFEPGEIGENIWLFLILFVMAASCLHYLFRFAHNYMNIMPEKYHDVRKILSLLNSEMKYITDIDEMKRAYQSVMQLMNIEIEAKKEINTDAKNKFENILLETIAFIRQDNNHTTKINHKFTFESEHPVVDRTKIAYFLGTLLENAIQTMTRKPIYIDIYSSDLFVVIKVSNEAKFQQKKQLKAMFSSNHSTKGKIGRGFGLLKLNQAVKKYNGEIDMSQEFQYKENTNYLSIILKFNKQNRL